ncbi:methyltransferase domain-containing protein [Oscillatoria sp. FACHB-1407]|uniref:methyltransferase domain-containing protein n=1 Tax=Oscillatoria sp. FACHB-1407 TaxID=2692847 RepID=UPI001682353A|nr:methyltransferase domain-containing protein [Oscillatoria sp. FACHB-1407]MBD2462321.1 methyltransferase domain-containing protein [Oscillatoria sp. FACHB-1407]
MNYKHQVADSFSHATSTYDTNAIVQQQCARELMTLLRSHQCHLPPGDVLEIGCGTGFVTQQLIECCGDRTLEITDISLNMLNQCQQNLRLTSEQRQQIVFKQLDGEAIDVNPDQYAIIVSNFVVQWFEQPAQSLKKLMATLKPNGLLLVSFPTHRSFPEWQHLCQQMDLPFTANPMPDPKDLTQQLTDPTVNCVCYEQTMSVFYNRAIDFFRSLKLIGAGLSRCQQKLSSLQMKQLIRGWNETNPTGIQVSYHIAFLVVQRSQ